MPIALYQRDFGTPDSQTEFAQLLERADHSHVLPWADNIGADSVGTNPTARAQQYAEVGDYIARQSHLLIALWDGQDLDKVGGTAHVIRRRQTPLEPGNAGPIYHIRVNRQSAPNASDQEPTLHELWPTTESAASGADTAHNIGRCLNTFNRDRLRLGYRIAHERERSQEAVLSLEDTRPLPRAFGWLLERYADADALASHFRRRVLTMLFGLLTLALGAAVCFALFDHWPMELNPARVIDPALLSLAIGWHLWGRWAGYERRNQDYRALAEGLRVQLFWRLAGLEDAVADYYLRKQRGELEWIRRAVLACQLVARELPLPGGAVLPPQTQFRLHLVLTRWVEGQVAYYGRAARRDQRQSTFINRLCYGLLGVGFVLAWIKVFLPSDNPITVAMGMAPIAAGLLHIYANNRGLSEHAMQYARMHRLFSRIQGRLSESMKARHVLDARELVLEVGKEVLQENGEWVLLHRQRPWKCQA